MRNRLLTFLTIITIALAAGAIDPGRAFVSAPESRFPIIPAMKRLDMLDYFRAGVGKPSPNRLTGSSRILSETDNSITIEEVADSGAVTTINIAAGAGKNDSVLILVCNYRIPAVDGSVDIYTTSWEKYPPGSFTLPVLADWVVKKPVMSREDLENLIPFVPAAFSFDPETNILTLTNTLESLLSPEDYARVKDSIRPQLTYRWNGRKMTLRK